MSMGQSSCAFVVASFIFGVFLGTARAQTTWFVFPSLQGHQWSVQVTAHRVDHPDRFVMLAEAREKLTKALGDAGIQVSSSAPAVVTVTVEEMAASFARTKWTGCTTARIALKFAVERPPLDFTVHRCVSKANLWGNRTARNAMKESFMDVIDETLVRLDALQANSIASAGPTQPADLLNVAMPVAAPGSIVTLLIPGVLLHPDGYFVRGGMPIYAADILISGSDVHVSGFGDWRTRGFPLMRSFRIEKVDQKRQYTEVELRGDFVVKLRFDPQIPDWQKAFGRLVLTGQPNTTASIRYVDSALASIATQTFTGPLAQLSQGQQRDLLLLAWQNLGAAAMGLETFRTEPYLLVDLGRDPAVYNDLKFNQPGRVAHVLRERLLLQIKKFNEPLSESNIVKGLLTRIRIMHKSFLDSDSPPEEDILEVYARTDIIREFAEAAITDQEFIDGSVVIVNGNRTKVQLAIP